MPVKCILARDEAAGHLVAPSSADTALLARRSSALTGFCADPPGMTLANEE